MNISKYKWTFAWIAFAILVISLITIAISFHSKSWFPLFIQVYPVCIAIYPVIIIFLQSRVSQEADTNRKLLSQEQNTNLQISKYQELVEQQIKAIQENTDKQINNYVEQTSYLVNELRNNSVLLAEILNQQLEDSIIKTQQEIKKANRKYSNTKEWKLLRTPEEKEQQLERMKNFLDWLEYRRVQFIEKYEKVKRFLGIKKLK